jgi:hypothetical protein
MNARTVVAASLAVAVATGSMTPALAASKGRHKPITGSYMATALPDPTGDLPAANKGKCASLTPTGRTTHAFTVPAAGTLAVQLHNTLDWSLDVRDGGGVLGASDGSLPTSKESVELVFRKKDAVLIGACNLTGEPSVLVTYTFTFK